ncbi:hypothetical protein OIU84_017733 [Salix udensis]|uniref:YTH domain-containing family protein n=1 Tax=Salix udensis TaxID=889485 RepID=A0AAD6PLB5_9ROSI|nr:hypothetical protein OIU84_017733 [Salix udensis]
MESIPSATDKAAGLLENLSLDSQTKTTGNPALATKLSTSQYGSSDLATNTAKPLQRSKKPPHVDPNAHYLPNGYPSIGYNGGKMCTQYVALQGLFKWDVYGDNGTFMYNQGYGYAPYGTYPSPNSSIPSMGYDTQLYGAQHYQYPSSFYPSSTSAGLFYPSNHSTHSQGHIASSDTTDKVPFSAGTSTRNPNNRVNAGSVNRSNGPASGAGFSSPLNTDPTRPISGMGQASGYMNLMYPNNRTYDPYGNRFYGQYESRVGSDFGSYAYNSWTSGRGWVVVDNKYKSRGHGYGNENRDGLNELNRGPRAKSFRNDKEFGAVAQTVVGQNLPLSDNNKEENFLQVPDREEYNREDFPEDYSDAKFFVIKSFSEDDVHKSIKYCVWTSTANGNKKLDAAYKQAKENPGGGCPVFLLFSVNTSGQFVGLAEMTGHVDFNKTVEYWQQDKWTGCFPLKWHIIKDVPNGCLRHITLENNENKPVTNSRDTQEVMFEKGVQILKIFKDHKEKTSILDDFGFYAARERIMQEKKAKQNIQKQVSEGKPAAKMGNDSLQTDAASIKEQVGVTPLESVKTNGEVNVKDENESDSTVANCTNDATSTVSSDNKVVPNVFASA